MMSISIWKKRVEEEKNVGRKVDRRRHRHL
jgi:hypothetical protein